MPHQLAATLLALEPRVQGPDETDPWFLAWQLAVGATYSLARAQLLLPGHHRALRVEALTVAGSIAAAGDMNESAFPTWALGYYLNSAEVRIQSAVHRILRAYTGHDGKAFALAKQILRYPQPQQPPQRAHDILAGMSPRPSPHGTAPGDALSRVWYRANALKHDPVHNPSDRFSFEFRWADSHLAIGEAASLLEILGVHHDAVAAA